MSKRPSSPSSDYPSGSNLNKSKRVKKTLDEIGLDSETDIQPTRELLDTANESEIYFDQEELEENLKSKVTKILTKTPKDQKITELTNIFKEILSSRSKNEKQNLGTIFEILLEYLSAESTKETDKLVAQIASLLTLQIDLVPLVVLKNAIDLFISNLKSHTAYNEKCIDLIVEIFKYVQKVPSTDDMGKSSGKKKESTSVEQNSGNEFVNRKLLEIFTIKWSQSTAMNIVLLVKEIQLDQNQLKQLLNKLFDLNEIAWPNIQIPTLINTILSFSHMKQNRPFLFERIIQFFADLRKKTPEQNRQKTEFVDAETLSILHIIHFIRTDHVIAKDLLKVLKLKLNRNIFDLIQPFAYALCLSLVKVLPAQDGVMDLLKQILSRIFESEMKWKQYYWICRTFSETERQLSSYLYKPSKCRLYSTDQILPSLIEFLFEIFDTYGVRMTKTTKATNLKEYLTIYASGMIRDLFKYVSISREEILNQMTERIFSSTITKSIVFIDQLSIMILTEPATYFQDFFRKFRSKMDHMIYMTPIVALEFLTAIKPLLKFDSVYKDNLIQTLKKSIFQSDLNVRKVGLNGLICLLTTTKLNTFLPSSQASQSLTLSQSQSQMSRVSMSQEKSAEKNCLEIFLSLRRCLTQQAEIRSKLHQSCCSLIVQNTTLIGPTLNLLLTSFESYLIRTEFDILLDLSKCFKWNETTSEIEIQEPVDVLLHALHLCEDKYTRSDMQAKFGEQLDEDIKKHSEMIKIYFNQLKQNFVQANPQFLLETYQSQVKLKMLPSQKRSGEGNEPAAQLPSTSAHTQYSAGNTLVMTTKEAFDLNLYSPFYQCLLGTIESLLEHFFMNGQYKSMRELYKKFNQLHELVQKLFTSGGATTGATLKQKAVAKKKTPAAKKSKKPDKENKNPVKSENDEDQSNEATAANNDSDENDDIIRASAQDQSKMTDLSTIENPLLESTTNVGSKKQTAAKTPAARKQPAVKFEYTHRISFSCLHQLLTIYFGNGEKPSDSSEFEQSADESLEEFLMQVRLEDSFHAYLMKILNQQLESILGETNNFKVSAQSSSSSSKTGVHQAAMCSTVVYDCESYTEPQLFKYLNQIWVIFWKQVTNMKCASGDCSHNEFYCENCTKHKMSYTRVLEHVWKTVAVKFSPKMNDLFSFSIFEDGGGSTQESTINCSNSTSIAVGILDLCRRFIDKCLISHTKHVPSALKLATQLIELMYDIGSSVTLQLNDYGILFKWVQSLSVSENINDQVFTKALFKFFIFITWNKNSSAALMKYICQDLVHLFGFSRANMSESISSTDRCFYALNNENSVAIAGIMYDELANILSLMEWFISFKQDFAAMSQLYKQLNSLLECLKVLLQLNMEAGSCQEQLIRTLSKFYNFMIFLCKSLTAREVNDEEKTLLKNVVDYTASKMQTPLNQFIRAIQNANSSFAKEAKKNGKKAAKENGVETQTSVKILRCARMIPNLVFSIEQYEQQLKLMNKHFKNEIDFTEKFELCLRDFKINLAQTSNREDDESTIASSNANDDDQDESSSVTNINNDQDDEEDSEEE